MTRPRSRGVGRSQREADRRPRRNPWTTSISTYAGTPDRSWTREDRRRLYRAAFGGSGVGPNRQEGRRRLVRLHDLYSYGCRRAFPCFDEPRFKTPWDISIIVPLKQSAFSNATDALGKRRCRDR